MKRSTRLYTVYSVIGTILEVGILLGIVLWGLPIVGIQIPPLGIAILLALMLGYSVYTYVMGRRALQKKLILELEAIIGQEGIVISGLEPEGYVRVGNELWKAVCSDYVEIGHTVIVTGVAGLKISVAPKARMDRRGSTSNQNLFRSGGRGEGWFGGDAGHLKCLIA